MHDLFVAPNRFYENMSDDFNVSMSGFYVTCAAHVQRLLLERAMILDWLWLQTPLYSYTH